MMPIYRAFYYGAVPDFDSTKLKLNGAYFKEEYLKRVNQQTAGRAEIKKQNFFIQDTWQVNKKYYFITNYKTGS